MTERGKLLVATGNAKKLKEIDAIIRAVCGADCPELVTTGSLGLESPDETGETFVDNALIKALDGFRATGFVTVADDSGLMVDALGGAPGVYSARYAGPDSDDAANNAKLMAALAGVPESKRSAAFRSAVAIVFPATLMAHVPGARLVDGDPAVAWVVAEGRVGGRIVDAPTGHGGFGYDPYFFHEPSGRTFAELSAEQKHALSHRGQALSALSPAFSALFARR